MSVFSDEQMLLKGVSFYQLQLISSDACFNVYVCLHAYLWITSSDCTSIFK